MKVLFISVVSLISCLATIFWLLSNWYCSIIRRKGDPKKCVLRGKQNIGLGLVSIDLVRFFKLGFIFFGFGPAQNLSWHTLQRNKTANRNHVQLDPQKLEREMHLLMGLAFRRNMNKKMAKPSTAFSSTAITWTKLCVFFIESGFLTLSRIVAIQKTTTLPWFTASSSLCTSEKAVSPALSP